MASTEFVPDGFEPPTALDLGWCQLHPLGEQHNEADFAAWHGSPERIAHIRATPGFAGRKWPVDDYTLEQNRADLAGHAREFAERAGFTFTVLDGALDGALDAALDAEGDVIGCLYIYPAKDGPESGADGARGCAPTTPNATPTCTGPCPTGWPRRGRSPTSPTRPGRSPHGPQRRARRQALRISSMIGGRQARAKSSISGVG